MSELFSFKAGKVEYNENTKEATPLRGQGLVVLGRSTEEEGFMGIQWKPRSTYLRLEPSEELMILPGDVEFDTVKDCKTGRVISMTFTSSSKKIFYWLQDPPTGNLDEFSKEDLQILEKLREISAMGIEDEEEEEEDEEEENDEDKMKD